jgi:hypothetical protein
MPPPCAVRPPCPIRQSIISPLIGPGLVKFIADLRNARARELEEKRINKELANIRFVPHLPLTLANVLQPEIQR